MSNKNIRVLHVDSGHEWRGGQQQAGYLLENMHAREYRTAIVCQPGSPFEKFCREKKLPYFPLRMRGEADLYAGFKLSGLCRKEGFNILHLHTAHDLAIGLWAKLVNRQIKLIGVRRVDFPIRKNFFSRLKYNNSLVDRLVCISDRIKDVMLDDGIPGHLLTTVHSGVDINKFDHDDLPEGFRAKEGMPEQHLIVGTVAAMAWHKDYPNLLKAARIVIDQTDNISFCQIGDGPDEKEILALAQKLDLGDRFFFKGFRTDVGNFLKTYDIFVLASCMEGLGTSILDAQSVGLPVIGSDAGGIPEAVHHNTNGLLVPPKNPEALASAIIELVEDNEKLGQFGKTAKQTVKKFSVENMVEGNLGLYGELIEE